MIETVMMSSSYVNPPLPLFIFLLAMMTGNSSVALDGSHCCSASGEVSAASVPVLKKHDE
jgi:hypothetical protein